MRELMSHPDLPHKLTRRELLLGGITVGLLFTAASCAGPEQSPGSSIKKISKEELQYPEFTIADLIDTSKTQELIGTNIRTQGYINIVDQDITFYNAYGKTYPGDKNIIEEKEELTYSICDSADRKGNTILAVDVKKYDLMLSQGGLDSSQTINENLQTEWTITGKVKFGEVEIGDKEKDKVEAVYLDIQGLYSTAV
jgi:hypothetical protein